MFIKNEKNDYIRQVFEFGVFLHAYDTYQFSHSVMSNSLQPHGLQHTRLLCPSPSPGVCSNSCPLSWWCHLSISSSVVPFSSCLESFSASGSFPVSQFSNQVAHVSELQLQHQSSQWTFRVDFLKDLTDLISFLSKGLSRSFSDTTVQKHQFFSAHSLLWSNSHLCTWLMEKP